MMNVAAMHRNIVERADVMADRFGESSEQDDRGEKADRREEQALAAGLRKALMVNPSQPCVGDPVRTRGPGRLPEESVEPRNCGASRP
jgi:hypothetical protein